ncbi:MarR family transcriptional regulator [[Eubacterium] cellulosolvens]
MVGGEEGLEHRSRKLIYNYISTHPGVSFGGLRNFFDMNESTLKYHLHYLERANKISSRREGRRRCYFGTHTIRSEHIVQPTMALDDLTRAQKQILAMIRNKPGITKHELIQRTKLNRKTVSYNLEKFLDQKMIWKVKNSEEIGYEYITKDKLRSEIYNQLLLKLLSDEIDERTFLRIKKKLETIDVDEIKI